MNRQTRLLASTLCAFAGLAMSAAAQTQVRGLIASGGTAAVSGGTVLVGSIGQPVIGPASASGTNAGQGFWYAVELNAPAAVDGESTTSGAALACSPNPCASGTTLRVRVPRSGRVRVTLFDALGNQARTIADDHYEAGTISLWLATSDLASGNYVVRLDAPGARDAVRIVVMK